ncbi:hypothetical protein DL546_000778 [Coniochaeta pulveracea]|uniref:Uncharacterized protein n=1 Tax=Coniochaeta pulveracea TaxID=177199 RepID=A0A420XW04_9PEZI|nr:hypothetical protein DL546_000778 [Coniochaeta pulveracea]
MHVDFISDSAIIGNLDADAALSLVRADIVTAFHQLTSRSKSWSDMKVKKDKITGRSFSKEWKHPRQSFGWRTFLSATQYLGQGRKTLVTVLGIVALYMAELDV